MEKVIKLFAIAVISIVSLSGCSKTSYPEEYTEIPSDLLPTSIHPLPLKPDYSKDESWGLLPHKPVPLPKGVNKTEHDPVADVFYIHPTIYDNGLPWVASLQDEELNSAVDMWTMRHQASAFASAGRMFAPRYRQAHYRSFSIGDKLSEEALRLSYSDVRDAFMYWMETWDEGRPLIIAGHSQGTWHARWLLQEFFDGTELGERLVAAYIPGMAMYEDDFNDICFCKSKIDINCVCTWMTFGAGYTPDWIIEDRADGQTTMCINPINWSTNEGVVNDSDEHLGALTEGFRLMYRKVLTVRIEGGILWLDQPKAIGGKKLHRDNWHVGDVNLFWANIRANSIERVEAYLDKCTP
jgi:hypothetical protein